MRKTIIAWAMVLASCTAKVENATLTDQMPDIYPDYQGVTIPVGIAPMNFALKADDYDCIDVVVKGSMGGQMHCQGQVVDLDTKEWHALTEQNRGGKLSFTVSTKQGDKWLQYHDFEMMVSEYALEEWGLTYRRVAPGYELFSHMGLYQRDLSTFDEYEIIDNNRIPGTCVNCHTSNRTNPQQFLFHTRGEHGATMVQKGGKMEALNTKTDATLGLCVYPYWHPDGRYVVFSTNTTRQSFHVGQSKRIEVFDTESDLQIYDTEKHELLLSPLVTQADQNETFPAFAPDGQTIYFCNTAKREYPRDAKMVRYNLCSIGFDAATGSYADSVTTVIDAEADSMSISIPKPSYDGRYIMYTVADYGTFPIWHSEADLWLMNLRTMEKRPLTEVNSSDTESYHNWSDNSHWFVFSSRRDDGLYTRLYISSIDENGQATKPFMLPQRDPRRYYSRMMYSYNVPDFTKTKVDIDQSATADAILDTKRQRITVKR